MKLLPSTPKELRRADVDYRGSAGAGSYALAVTRERAYVWDYTSHSPTSNVKVFDIPFAVKRNEPTPFGALVTAGASSDVGLVLLSANTGKVAYYESIDRAAALGLFQERNVGMEGSIGQLFSGETVINVTSAGHAGFILTLSSGRIAQLTLRDAQGKSRVAAQFLKASEPQAVGIFGSIRGFLSAGPWKRDVAAVHTRALGTRGQMQVISLTESVELQVWDLDWSGQNRFKMTLDFRELVAKELGKLGLPELRGKEEHLQAIDFAILPPPSNSTEVTTLGAELPLDLLVLFRAGTSDNFEYVLVGVSIEGHNPTVPQVLPISTYHGKSAREGKATPMLLLQTPEHSALIAFDNGIVIKDMDDTDANSPEAQLHASYIQPTSFEDTINFKPDENLSIVGGFAEKDGSSKQSALLFIRGSGLERVSVADPKDGNRASKLPVKSKIEQAVFHGLLQEGNIIDFSRKDDHAYTSEEVEGAILAISDEVLRSTSPYISDGPTSIEAFFTHKALVLKALVTYARQTFPALSRAATWQLLWDAERVAAGNQLWLTYETHVEAAGHTKRTATVFDAICDVAQHQPASAPSTGDDPVWHFLVRDLHRMGGMLDLAYKSVIDLKEDNDTSTLTKFRMLSEAAELWTTALNAAFAFRAEKAATYGILPESIEHGVLNDEVEFAELAEFWTSTEPILKAVVKLTEFTNGFAADEFETADRRDAEAMLPLIQRVGQVLPRLIELTCSVYEERIGWLASRPSQRDKHIAEKLRENYRKERSDQLRKLPESGQAEAGMRIAEKCKDFSTLTELIVAETQFSVAALQEVTDASSATTITNYIDSLTDKTGGLFERYGDEWANAFFDFGFAGAQAGVVLRNSQMRWQEPLSKYLHADKSRAKISWINDVLAGGDYGQAANALLHVANEQETDVWSKKVELSLGKLSLLAAQEGSADKAQPSDHHVQRIAPTAGLQLISIQERVYWHLWPEVKQGIDFEARVEIAMQKFATRLQDLHSLRRLLESYFDRLLSHAVLSVDELVDVLTLMDSSINTQHNDNLQGEEFYLALQALDAAFKDMQQGRFETLLQLIWKRCYVHDDWAQMKTRSKHSEEELDHRLRQTAAWRTLHYALDNSFFDQPDCKVRHLPPSECLDAGCRPEDLSYRWSNPDLLDPILHDNRIQDEQLNSFVTDRKLDEWIALCLGSVKADLEAKAEHKAHVLERERVFEGSVKQGYTNGDKMNGHAVNGIAKIDGNAKADDVDSDGDFDME